MAQRRHGLCWPTAESHLWKVPRSPGAQFRVSQYPLLTGVYAYFQLRLAFVTYGLPSTRPSPILCKRYFSKLEVLKRDSLEVPELVGLGQVSDEDSERHGTAMLDAFACALEVRSPDTLSSFKLSTHFSIQMFDLLDATPISNSTHTLRQILHVAAYPSDNARNPAWNVNPDLDHLSWSNLPQELQKVRTPCTYIAQRRPT
jgi:mediator of RNA polymerase II transcription subunit 25